MRYMLCHSYSTVYYMVFSIYTLPIHLQIHTNANEDTHLINVYVSVAVCEESPQILNSLKMPEFYSVLLKKL